LAVKPLAVILVAGFTPGAVSVALGAFFISMARCAVAAEVPSSIKQAKTV
jgi:hypothetical protein